MNKIGCRYFRHPYPKGHKEHIHICDNKENITKRCGYKIEDSVKCPLWDENAWLVIYIYPNQYEVKAVCPICHSGMEGFSYLDYENDVDGETQEIFHFCYSCNLVFIDEVNTLMIFGVYTPKEWREFIARYDYEGQLDYGDIY